MSQLSSNYLFCSSAITMQCLSADGPAVERARTFVALVNDSINYDDDAVCLQSGIYKLAESNPTSTSTAIGTQIQPNPARDQIEVTLTGKLEGMCRIELLDALGQMVIAEKMNCKDQTKTINISTLKQGMYSVKVYMNTTTLLVQKLSIIR